MTNLKLIFALALLIAECSFCMAQTDTISNWKRSVQTGVNINQASFSDNWKGGGVNSLALGAFFNGKANYEDKNITFTNEIEMLYGFLRNKGQSSRKTTDRIYFDSKIGYKLTPVWNVFGSVNFLSQFDLGYHYSDTLGEERKRLISKFFSPAYLTSSVGLEYKPVSYFWLRFGVGTFRQTFVGDKFIYRDQPLNYGVPVGKTVRNELAFQFIAYYDKDIATNLNLKTRFTAFANYETLDAIDTRLDIVITAKVNRFVNVNLTGTALYDQDMDLKIQYSQGLALGVLFNYSEFPKN